MSSSNRRRARGALRDVGRGGVAEWEPDLLARQDPAASGDAGTSVLDPDVASEPDPRLAAEARERLRSEERARELDDAYARGFDAGRAQGEAAEGGRLDSAIRAVAAAAAEFEERQPGWLRKLDENLVALAIAIAREVAGRELRGSADDIRALVHQAMEEFPLRSALRVRLNPVDLSAISSPRGGEGLPAGYDVRWIPDPAIAPGGCFVEGPNSLVDGRVDKALERIYDRLIHG